MHTVTLSTVSGEMSSIYQYLYKIATIEFQFIKHSETSLDSEGPWHPGIASFADGRYDVSVQTDQSCPGDREKIYQN